MSTLYSTRWFLPASVTGEDAVGTLDQHTRPRGIAGPIRQPHEVTDAGAVGLVHRFVGLHLADDADLGVVLEDVVDRRDDSSRRDLGVFGLAIGSRRRGSDGSATVALAVGSLTGLALFLHPIVLGETRVAWPWWIPISATLALAAGALARTNPPVAKSAGAG